MSFFNRPCASESVSACEAGESPPDALPGVTPAACSQKHSRWRFFVGFCFPKRIE